MPGEGGAPSDIGPDGGVLPPDALGPDGLPMGGEDPMGDPMADEEGFPPDGEDDEEGGPPEDVSGPPGDADDGGEDEAPPPPKKKPKGKSKKESARTYQGPDGVVMTEDQYIRHLAVAMSGNSAELLARMRKEARDRGPYLQQPWPGAGDVIRHIYDKHPEILDKILTGADAAHRHIHEAVPDTPDHVHGEQGGRVPVIPRIGDDRPAELDRHLQTHHGFAPGESGYQPDDTSGYAPAQGARLGNTHDEEHATARDYLESGQPFPPGVMPVRHVHPNDNGAPLEEWEMRL